MTKIKQLLIKYKELLLYLVFGLLTTVVNLSSFAFFTKVFGEDLYLISNAIAWLVAVIFAFITNKLFVFESKSWRPKILVKELTEFFGARIFTFVIEEGGMWLLVDALAMGERSWSAFGFTIGGQIVSKVVIGVVVIIINYFFSKFIIFKKSKKQGDS